MIPVGGVLNTSLRWPPVAAYAFLAGIVFVGRELDLVHEFLFGNGIAHIENPLAEFIGQTVTNT